MRIIITTAELIAKGLWDTASEVLGNRIDSTDRFELTEKEALEIGLIREPHDCQPDI